MKIEKNKILYKTINFFFPNNLIQVLKDQALKKKYQRISVNSYESVDDLHGFKKRKKTTHIINLKNKTIEEIFSGFNSQTKNKINRSFKNNTLNFKNNDSNFLENYRLYANIEYAQGRVPENKNYFKQVAFFSAYLKNELISNIGVIDVDGKILRVINISSKRLSKINKDKYKIISIASRRIVYEICKYGIENNFEKFDFCGINFEDPLKKGINDFKLGFGGETVSEYIYVYKGKAMKYFEKMFFLKKILFGYLKR